MEMPSRSNLKTEIELRSRPDNRSPKGSNGGPRGRASGCFRLRVSHFGFLSNQSRAPDWRASRGVESQFAVDFEHHPAFMPSDRIRDAHAQTSKTEGGQRIAGHIRFLFQGSVRGLLGAVRRRADLAGEHVSLPAFVVSGGRATRPKPASGRDGRRGTRKPSDFLLCLSRGFL